MTDITFIRHGQASIHSNNYDQLSDLGWKQASLLGEALKEQGFQADHVFHGSLRRQRETYEAIRPVSYTHLTLPTTSRV